MPHTNTYLTEALWDDPGGGGAAGQLVGPAGVGSGAGMRGEGISELLRGQQQWKKYTSTLADKKLIQNDHRIVMTLHT